MHVNTFKQISGELSSIGIYDSLQVTLFSSVFVHVPVTNDLIE